MKIYQGFNSNHSGATVSYGALINFKNLKELRNQKEFIDYLNNEGYTLVNIYRDHEEMEYVESILCTSSEAETIKMLADSEETLESYGPLFVFIDHDIVHPTENSTIKQVEKELLEKTVKLFPTKAQEIVFAEIVDEEYATYLETSDHLWGIQCYNFDRS
jgi:hypothetical protein